MLQEGKNPVRESLKSNQTIEKIVVLDKTPDHDIRELVSIAKEKNIRVEFASKQTLDRISQTGHHQGIIAVTTQFEYSELLDVLEDCEKNNKRKFFIVLDKLSDPHNLGSIIRTAECANVSGVIIPNRNSVLVNETVIRTSAGATNFVKVIKVNNINDAIKTLKENNVFVYASDMDGESIYKTSLKGNVAFIIGSEGFGVSRLTKELADQVVSIPMEGKINSLNASVSAAICIYEAFRQDKL